MLSFRHAGRRLSQLFIFSSLMVILASGCGKDAAIQLTKPDPPVPTTKFLDFSLTAPEPGAVGAELTHAHGKDTLTDVGQRKVEVPIGSTAHLKVNIPKGWEVNTWDCVPPGHVDYDRDNKLLTIKNVQMNHSLLVNVRKIPVVAVASHKVYFKIETEDSGTIWATIPSEKKIMKFSGEGHRSLSLPKGKDLALSLKLPRNWEIEKWIVSEDADYNSVGKSPDLVVKNIKSDLSVTAKLRKVPWLKFTVRVAGKTTLFGKDGSGSIVWKVFRPGEAVGDVRTSLGADGNVSTSDEEDLSKGKDHTFSYLSGSVISVEYKFSCRGRLLSVHNYVTLTENKTLAIDFHKVADIDFDAAGSPSFNEAVGFQPKAQQEPDIIYEEAKLFEAAEGKE